VWANGLLRFSFRPISGSYSATHASSRNLAYHDADVILLCYKILKSSPTAFCAGLRSRADKRSITIIFEKNKEKTGYGIFSRRVFREPQRGRAVQSANVVIHPKSRLITRQTYCYWAHFTSCCYRDLSSRILWAAPAYYH
jgi:hypothetical protein